MTLKEAIVILAKKGFIADIALHFADFICTRSNAQNNEALYTAATLTSHVTSTNKFICLPMEKYAGKALKECISDIPEEEQAGDVKLPELIQWRTAIEASSSVGAPGETTFMILDTQNRLYLQKYRQYQQTIAEKIAERVKQKRDSEALNLIASRLINMFRKSNDIDWQKVAAAMAIYNNFTVITGGPGTGKTYTIAKIISACHALYPERRIALAAPTGKAAARVKESLRDELTDNTQLCDAVTLHSLLKINPRTHLSCYNQANPLDADIVIVDETSMIPFALMAKLLSAIAPSTSLVLVGDKDQLASVEAGAVLNDLCMITKTNVFSKKTAEILRKNNIADIPETDISDHPYAGVVCELRKNYRQKDAPEIAELSARIKVGDVEESLKILRRKNTNAELKNLPEINTLHLPLIEYIEQHIAPLYTSESCQQAYEMLLASLILCSHRVGPYGSESINKKIESLLQRKKIIHPLEIYYHCRPIMILTNAYDLKVYNGDVGLVWQKGDQKGAFFKDSSGGMRCIPVSRLPMHTTAYAVTIHKSQGSEAQEVQLYLSDTGGTFITRELVYTGVTRAKKSVKIYANKEMLRQGIEKVTERPSGICDAIKALIE